MKILHVKAKGILNKESEKVIRNKIESCLERKFLITDDSLEVEVLELDEELTLYIDGESVGENSTKCECGSSSVEEVTLRNFDGDVEYNYTYCNECKKRMNISQED